MTGNSTLSKCPVYGVHYSAWEACKASVIGVRQDQQVCQSILPEGQEEIRWPIDAATFKASSVPAIAVLSEALT